MHQYNIYVIFKEADRVKTQITIWYTYMKLVVTSVFVGFILNMILSRKSQFEKAINTVLTNKKKINRRDIYSTKCNTRW